MFKTIELTKESKELASAREEWVGMGSNDGERKHAIYNHTNFPAFCRYLVGERGYNASDLVGVIESPWKWGDEYKQYLIWRGCEGWHGADMPSLSFTILCPLCEEYANDADDLRCVECRANNIIDHLVY